jgi:hypothetical protein
MQFSIEEVLINSSQQIVQARAGRPEQEAWAGQGDWHGGEHRRGYRHHPVQGPTTVQSQSEHQVPRDTVVLQPHPQLDPGLHLHPRSLPLLVWVDGSSGIVTDSVTP